MTAIVDYGVGNLFSLQCSLQALNVPCKVTAVAEELAAADRVILPGVGAFADAMQKLEDKELDTILVGLATQGKPLLGICLGMQLLFDKSYEFGERQGLGLITGKVISLKDKLKEQGSFLKVPHMGWNTLQMRKSESPLLQYTKEGEAVYYVHSFFATKCEEYTVATSEYGVSVTGAVQRGNVYGTQFHPEKSGDVGLRILRAFCEI